ncbi:MAG: hypothetical protein KHX62_05890 [Firmicutes bacterium]|nr:hypothetical protein [Bacillota bacterium]
MTNEASVAIVAAFQRQPGNGHSISIKAAFQTLNGCHFRVGHINICRQRDIPHDVLSAERRQIGRRTDRNIAAQCCTIRRPDRGRQQADDHHKGHQQG